MANESNREQAPTAAANGDPQADRAQALDLLIEQERELSAVYDAKRSNAETKATGVLTAALALGTLVVTGASSVEVSNWLPLVVFGALGVAGALALFAQSGAGLQHRRRHWVSSESQDFVDAIHRLRAGEKRGDASALDVRALALDVWEARAKHARDVAREKERWAAAAAVALGVALFGSAAFGITLITTV